jgi:hypothetical protein
MRFNDVLNAMVILAVLLIIGFVSGLHVGRTSQKRVTDTITTVQLIERPVTIRDSVHTKSVTIKTKDTIYFLDKPVVIPCGDTAFVAQSDSVITATRDTINMAFAYANRKGHFSLVYRPRPDSIKVITLPTEVRTENNWGWVVGALGIGLGLGVYYGRR